MSLFKYLLAVAILLSMSALAEAHALIDSGSYGIVLSQGCRTNLKNNLTTTCPTYQEIMLLFPDTSEKKIIGDFGFKDGMYQRLHSNYKNPEGYYNSVSELSKDLMIIDPPAKLWNRLNLIEIRPNLDDFRIRERGLDKSYNAIEHSLTLGFGRYVDSCRLAYVDSENWIFMVGDSINLINNKCDPAFTQFNGTKTTYFQKAVHDITTSYKYKLEQWIKQAVERCSTKNCNYEEDNPAP